MTTRWSIGLRAGPDVPGWPALLAVVLLAAASGCVSDGSRPCAVAADCASGVCQTDGVCAPVVVTNDAASDVGADASTGADTSDVAGLDALDSPDPNVCVPNRDGVVTRSELPIAPGLRATYAVATDVAFDTRAGVGPDGGARWELGVAQPGDQRVLVEALDPADWWFGAAFPTATYVTRLDAGGDLLGVFRLSDDALELLAVVSPTDGLLRTELRYEPPARMLTLPLELGTEWTTTSTVTGVTNGVPTVASERYASVVDAAGTVATPFAELAALRVVVSLDRLVGAAPYFDVQHLFVAECFGTVAVIRSQPYVASTEFSSAAELRRLAP